MIENHPEKKRSSQHYHNGRDECPVCGREYLFKASKSLSMEIYVYGLYRHERNGKVYFHELEYGKI